MSSYKKPEYKRTHDVPIVAFRRDGKVTFNRNNTLPARVNMVPVIRIRDGKITVLR